MSCLDKAAFVVRFGEVYEHSPWVAEEVFDAIGEERFDTTTLSAEDLAARFEGVFLNVPKQQQLDVLRAHPALAVAPAERGDLTAQSSSEQAGAGLNQCTESEFALFQEMNAMYFGRFDFPFIIAVKGRQRQEILDIFRGRLLNSVDEEFQAALHQVCRIARIRIDAIVNVPRDV
jgi:OHCU decarboxylase